jgi:3-hydroxymyristoyl/3-hydroxydecanoyl-(acyl carrier protein) dehydratase
VSDAPARFPRLPHAAPFLLLDRVLEVGERRGAFLKLVTATDPCVSRDGCLPPLLVLEAMAQGGGALLLELEDGGTPGYLASVDDFRVHGDVRVGDALRVEVELLRSFAGAVAFRGRAVVDGEVRAEGRFTLALPR